MEAYDSPENLVLIAGKSATGKSASLMGLKNPEKWMYLNVEKKRLPFKNKFSELVIHDPDDVPNALAWGRDNPTDFDGAIIDTLTFLMDLYESTRIIGAADSRAQWQGYQQYFKSLMHHFIPQFRKPVIMLAHTVTNLSAETAQEETVVPVKGALKNTGVEAYFSTVVAAKKMRLKDLEPFQNDMLNITPDDENLGYKHVFQTRLTKDTKGDRIRSPIGMFTVAETYIDNDVQQLLNHLQDFYS